MYLSTRTQRCLFVCVRTGTLVGVWTSIFRGRARTSIS